LFGGLIDVVINYTNYSYLTEKDSASFTLLIFLSAASIGLVVLIIRGKPIRKNNLKGGTALGIINYFSVYFLLRTLTGFNNDGAMVYPMLNMGIILGAMLVSIIYFHEHLDLRKKLGIVISIIAIFLISYQELFNFFK
jgi:drug/metabolite transporter (DMT)-like permease